LPAPVQQVPAAAAIAIMGRTVDGADGKDIARIADVLVDATGAPVAAVIDFGGFLGVSNRKIAVDWKTLKFAPADKDHAIRLEMTADQIKAAPDYKEQETAAVVTHPAAAPPPPVAAAPTPPVAVAPPPVPAPAPSTSPPVGQTAPANTE
jgi:hypothetical protein